jgi:hypothetical protein
VSLYLLNENKGKLKMKKAISFEEIEKGIETLELQEQLELMEKLIHLMKKSELSMKKKLDWNELYGLGKGLWNGEDAQEYVDHLREERI